MLKSVIIMYCTIYWTRSPISIILKYYFLLGELDWKSFNPGVTGHQHGLLARGIDELSDLKFFTVPLCAMRTQYDRLIQDFNLVGLPSHHFAS